MSNSTTTTVKIFNLLFVLLLIPLISTAQEDLFIKGIVKDLGTGLPLQDCHVYVSNKKFGTITKSDGSFELILSKKCLTESLVISHFGYEKYIIPVHNIDKRVIKIKMERKVISLAKLPVETERTGINYNDHTLIGLVKNTSGRKFIIGFNIENEMPESNLMLSFYYYKYNLN